MKNIILLIIVIAFSIACQQKENKNPQSNKINIGEIDSLFSTVLNEQRKIWVYVPGNRGPAVSSKTKYPVLYLLDGDGHFSSVVGMVQHFGNSICPEMIIVGIPNTDRTRDLTPTFVREVFGDTTFSKTSGGAENFTKFIETELIPYIDKNFPTTSYRTLIGHSLGGLYAINTLINHTDLFANYLAIDPSLWWDGQKLSTQAATALEEKKFENKSLFLAVANTMKEGMQLSDLPTDTTESTEHIRSILKFNESTKTKTNSGLRFESKYYSDDDHGSVPLIAEYDALRFMFSWYRLKGIDEYFDSKSKVTIEEIMSHINNHYKNVSLHFGYDVLPPESFINSLGYGFLQNGLKEKAYAFFNMNIKNYPESSNVFDSMGDYYVAQKDTLHAIENFSKALTLADSPYTKEKLKKMKDEK
jgi:uncharacterized protein